MEHAGREYIFRLYFVDAPETSNDFKHRTSEQARYFGLRKKETIQLGRQAAQFAKEFLSGSFKVVTCMKDAKGQSSLPRHYAIVEKDGVSLAEELVRLGLSRVCGMTAPSRWPGGCSPDAHWERLEKIEEEAKAEVVGGWELKRQRQEELAARRAEREQGDVDATEAEEVQEGEELGPSMRVNVNTAAEEQLDEIPDIGPKLASRIIAARPFRTLDEVQEEVKGIGRKTLETMQAFAYASPAVPLPGTADYVLRNPVPNARVQVMVDCVRWSGEEAPGGYRALAAVTKADGQFGGEILVFVKPSQIPAVASYFGVEEDGETVLMQGRLYELDGRWGITAR